MKGELDVFYDEENQSYGFVLYEQHEYTLKRGKLIDRSDSDCGGWKAAYCLGQLMSEKHEVRSLSVRAVVHHRNGSSSATYTLFPWNDVAEDCQ